MMQKSETEVGIVSKSTIPEYMGCRHTEVNVEGQYPMFFVVFV